jgi:hypothetical protein
MTLRHTLQGRFQRFHRIGVETPIRLFIEHLPEVFANLEI